jgi:hypothetical protein
MSDYGSFERMVELARGEWIASTPELDWLAFELRVEQGKAKALRRRADSISMKPIIFGSETEAFDYLASKGYSLNSDRVTTSVWHRLGEPKATCERLVDGANSLYWSVSFASRVPYSF